MYAHLSAGTGTSLNWLVKNYCNKFWTESVSHTNRHHGSWGLPIFNVKMVENHILGHWKNPRSVSARRMTEQGVLQVWRDSRRVPCFIFMAGVHIAIAWIRWIWNFKANNSCVILQKVNMFRTNLHLIVKMNSKIHSLLDLLCRGCSCWIWKATETVNAHKMIRWYWWSEKINGFCYVRVKNIGLSNLIHKIANVKKQLEIFESCKTNTSIYNLNAKSHTLKRTGSMVLHWILGLGSSKDSNHNTETGRVLPFGWPLDPRSGSSKNNFNYYAWNWVRDLLQHYRAQW